MTAPATPEPRMPRDMPGEDDDEESVAGEEDPGAALDGLGVTPMPVLPSPPAGPDTGAATPRDALASPAAPAAPAPLDSGPPLTPP